MLQVLSIELFDDYVREGLSHTDDKRYINLSYWDKLRVDRIINNLIRTEFY